MNEAYLRLIEITQVQCQVRVHFFAMASRLMRRVLVDAARTRHAGKRGQNRVCVTFDDARMADPRAEAAPDVLALDDALTELAALDARKAQVVELRFFGGLTVEETAVALDISPETIARDWRFAKLWLRRAIMKDRRE